MGRKAKRVEAEVVGTETEAANSQATNEISEASSDSAEALNESSAAEVGAGFDIEPHGSASTVVIDELGAIDLESIETPLADVDEAALEAGIASVFDTILAESFEAPVAGNDDHVRPDDETEEPTEASEAAVNGEDASDPTYALLAELNRLWAQPLAA